ncbi:MAG: Sir2 family NAD-dependent protein deacetylase [Thermoanaerobaculia bacterium]
MAETASPFDPALESLAQALEAAAPGLIVAVTGAGISLASGIPTFRGSDPGAVWKVDLTELATFRYFQEDPAGSWQWYLQRFDRLGAARPNAAHLALAELERWQLARGGEWLLITQNIDTLHEQAGSRQLIKVHGSSDRFRCSRRGCELGEPRGSIAAAEVDLSAFRAHPGRETVPRCPRCGSPLRQHVLWFDEMYTSHRDYQWEYVQGALEHMRLALAIGTSFAVGFTERVLQAAYWNKVPLVAIDPGRAPEVAIPGLEHIAAKAEELLPALLARLHRP